MTDQASEDYPVLDSVAAEPPERTAESQWGTVTELGLDGQAAAACGCAPPIECQQHRQARQRGAWRYRPGL